MEAGSLRRLLFGSPLSERSPDGRDPAVAHLDCVLRELIELLRAEHGLKVETGRFAASMEVELVNKGPVTIVLDTDELLAPRK